MGRLGRLSTKEKISAQELQEQKATPVANSNRDLWSGGLVSGLTPERLAELLNRVRRGECPAEYLEIAGELEERDAHYRSVLSTRKHSVEGLGLYVEAGDGNASSVKTADAVRENILEHDDMIDLAKNALDALGKGFSVNEIIWETTGSIWKPKEMVYRDPRWFAYDKNGKLCLRDLHGSDLQELSPYKFIIHEPNLLSGKQITSGLSFTALFYWLVKTYDVTSWAAFADRFGYPVRLGKYGRKATKEDIATLKRAVAAIGSDIGAVIPDAMAIDIIESKSTAGNSQVYEKIAEWADKQLSKLVLGQTASTEGTPGKLGNDKGQEEVRQDIIKADVKQLEQTLNRDLVKPFVMFNFGAQKVYPKLRIKYVEPKNIELIVKSIKELVPYGLKVKSQEINNLLGLEVPEDDDEILAAPQPAPQAMMNSENKKQIALNASEVTQDENEDEELPDGYIQISDEIAEVIEKAADKSTDFKSFKKQLEKLVTDWDANKTAELMAIAFFKARADGDNDFEKED